MRFCSINIYSGERHDGQRKKQLTKLLRHDSDRVLDAYLQCFKYYNNEKCISLNISCDEDISEWFIEEFAGGYPVLHIPFDLEAYSAIGEGDKSSFWLKTVYDCVRYVSEAWGWDNAFFDDVYERCAERLGSE